VEHSSLRNTLSTWVRTVLGLMDSFCATAAGAKADPAQHVAVAKLIEQAAQGRK